MSDFWARQRAKVEEENPKPVLPSSQFGIPWWAQGSRIVPDAPVQDYVPVQDPHNPKQIDGHDVSKAGILQGRAEECPMCPSDPRTGIRGNMYRPTPSTAMRCFDCGYMDNNRFEGQTAGLSSVSEGPARKARQVASGGGVVHNYQGNISAASQAAGRVS